MRTTFLLAPLALSACATVSRGRATIDALRAVCGAPSATRDSSCIVRSAEKAPGGYVVTVDRRPPSGNDRVGVYVRRGRIEVTPLDSVRSASDSTRHR
jgi:hypothetical protein